MHKSVSATSEDRPYGFDRKVRVGEILRDHPVPYLLRPFRKLVETRRKELHPSDKLWPSFAEKTGVKQRVFMKISPLNCQTTPPTSTAGKNKANKGINT